MENVIHTQSRWVLKGQMCNLLTLTDAVAHLASHSNEMEKGKMGFGNGER